MGSFLLLLLLTIAGVSHGYILADDEPNISWPENYHFNAEEINMVTGIMKPFEIWYSSKYNRSRIDLYGGTVSRYYYGMWYDEHFDEHEGKIYMIHPEVSEDETETVIKCEFAPHWDDQRDLLPPLEEFEYSGTQDHDGKEVMVWKLRKEESESGDDQTLLIEDLGNGVGIPLHHIKRSFDMKGGSLMSDVTINYYNYNDHVTAKDLDADVHECVEWGRFPDDFESAIDRLHPSISSDVDMAFHRFKRHHMRDYVDEEHHSRKMIFKQKWEKIVAHNSKKLSYKMGLNQFADKTNAELAYLNSVRTNSPAKGTHPFPHTEEELASMVAVFPEEYDLRSEGIITPVRNQAHCGSCWAFAMAATVEGALARKNGGRLMDLSEQSLVDCAWNYQSHGCMGTMSIEEVFRYVKDHGLPTVEEYGPYLEEDGICKIKNMTKLYDIKGYVSVTKNSPNALKAAIYKYSPVTIGVLVTENMAMYKSGVLYDFECETGPMNHAVTLVGYGVQDGEDYWIVKNSWGESWGEGGYFRISAKDNNCNVMMSPIYPVM